MVSGLGGNPSLSLHVALGETLDSEPNHGLGKPELGVSLLLQGDQGTRSSVLNVGPVIHETTQTGLGWGERGTGREGGRQGGGQDGGTERLRPKGREKEQENERDQERGRSRDERKSS